MAGTMPHAIFVETGLDGGATVAAYAAELPGCATFAPSDREAAGAIPHRVARFTAWLRDGGEEMPAFVGDNWYEVERATCDDGPGGRATFTLDELPPSDEEWGRWMRWLELAREELAAAVDAAAVDTPAVDAVTAAATGKATDLASIAAQDQAFAALLGADDIPTVEDPVDRLYVARDLLTAALEAAGASAEGVRRILRIAIADDLRAAERLRGGGD